MPDAIRAQLGGSDKCSAEGITVVGNAPVFMLCRKLIKPGINPDTRMEVYRVGQLALTIRSIGAGARLTVKDRQSGQPYFARYSPPPNQRPGAEDCL